MYLFNFEILTCDNTLEKLYIFIIINNKVIL